MRTSFPEGMVVNEEQKLKVQQFKLQQVFARLASTSFSRASLAGALGQTYGGDRDLYGTLGYKKDPTFADYNNCFTRQDISRRIVTAYPDATWRGKPEVYETEDPKETPFEKDWNEVMSSINLFHYFNRVDKLAGIGRYAVLFLGFDDGEDPSSPVKVKKGRKLMYVQPFSENKATIKSSITDPKNVRFGLPEKYELTVDTATSISGKILAHWSRVLHVADGLTESNVFGTPRLECVLNRLQDLERVVGGASEMFWRGAFPGLSLEMDPTAKVSDEDALEEEINQYIHNLRRVMRLKGIKANNLSVEVADPKGHVEVILQLISGATTIPVRILTGSERGELASSQDKENWNDRVAERREDFAGPVILSPFIDRLIQSGVLTPPSQETKVTVNWPDEDALSDKEQADIAKIRAEALQKYLDSGASNIVPPITFLTLFMGFSQLEAEAMLKEAEVQMEEEEKEAEALAKEQARLQKKTGVPPPEGEEEAV